MESKILKFRTVDRDIFDMVRGGRKRVETRAAVEKYRRVKVGDVVTLVCGKHKLRKRIKHAEIFRTIAAMLKKYKTGDINPACKSVKELREMYYGFPGYREKIRKHGLVAWELE